MLLNYFFGFLIFFFIVIFFIYLRVRAVARRSQLSAEMKDFELMEVQISKHDEYTPNQVQLTSLSAESMFAALHGLLKEDPSSQEHFSFEVVSSGVRGIKFYTAVPKQHVKFVEGQIYAQYPSAKINVVDDYTKNFDPAGVQYDIATVILNKPYYFPIKGYRDFEVDSLSSFTSAMSAVLENEEIWFQVLARPIPDIWQKEGYDYVDAVREGKPIKARSGGPIGYVLRIFGHEAIEVVTGIVVGLFTIKEFREAPGMGGKTAEEGPPKLSPTQELELKSVEDKLSKMGYEVVIRVMASSPDRERLESHLRSVLASMKQYTTSTLNSFGYEPVSSKTVSLQNYKSRYFNLDKSIVLNTEELASIYHFPSSKLDTPNISWTYSRKSEPPSNLPVTDCNYIGYTTYRSKKMKFGISNAGRARGDDRLRHMYLIGKSGTGKSTLLETMISQDIINGEGVGVLDPHGETIERVLERIPDHRVDDIIYFDPADTTRPMGLNLLEFDDPSQKNLMASGLVSAIKQHFEYSWGPRLEYLLNYAILTLLDVPGTTMLGITRLLEDKNYQNFILQQVKDPLVIRFWEKEYKEMKGNQKLVTEAIAPIQNKVNRFLASTTIRNILGQAKSTLDLNDAMNSGKILLMNLSKGKIGADNANLLGALLVSRLQFYALQRVQIPYEKRKPFYLYVDEFQNFATGSFEEVLSESRKYKLGLYLTHQFTAQLPENLLKAVFGNVGTIATFALGAPDARVMANEFAPHFSAEDIISLERFYIYMKLMIGGMTSHPFSARILVPWEEDNFVAPTTSNKDRCIKLSRDKYGVDSSYVESKINKWVETPFDKGMAIAMEYKKKKENQDLEESKSSGVDATFVQ